jgi:hypothetical protein
VYRKPHSHWLRKSALHGRAIQEDDLKLLSDAELKTLRMSRADCSAVLLKASD